MSAAILILITLCQLMLTPSASILNEVINDVTLLKNELNTFMAQDGNTTQMSAHGEFVRPPKVDTTIIKNKLHKLQNNVTNLAEAFSNKNQNVDDIKNRISTMEKEIENLNKLNDDKDREITQNLAKFLNIISDLLVKYKNLQDEEFLEAIKHKYYQLAAVKFATMKNESNAINLVRTVYEESGDLPQILEFADHVNNLKRKVLIYRTIVNLNIFQHCHQCNLLLTCKKVMDISNNYEITGDELAQIVKEIYFILENRVSALECTAFSIKKYPGRVLLLLQRYCSSDFQFGPLAKAGIHDYSGYCYPIDSIYSLLQ